jgi:signal transduction histidine kinase/DNA-binding response OmpR family regulator/ligand-binding sensor domain-containing protein
MLWNSTNMVDRRRKCTTTSGNAAIAVHRIIRSVNLRQLPAHLAVVCICVISMPYPGKFPVPDDHWHATRMHILRTCIAIGATLIAWGAFGQLDPQRWMVRNYSVEDGLSQTTVGSIVQDRAGFIWIATEDGINRFDGREFKVYREAILGDSQIPFVRILQVFTSSDDVMLAGADEQGICHFDRDRDRFEAISIHPSVSSDPGSNAVRWFAECDSGSVVVGTLSGAFVYDLRDRSVKNLGALFPIVPANAMVTGIVRTGSVVLISFWEPHALKNSLFEIRADMTSAVVLDPQRIGLPVLGPDFQGLRHLGDSVVQALFNERLFIRTPGVEAFKEYKVPGFPTILAVYRVHGNTLALTPSGLYDVAQDLQSAQRIALSTINDRDIPQQLNTLHEGSDGSLWIGSYNGLYQVDVRSAKFHHYGPWGDTDLRFSDHKVRGLLKDSSGRIWVGTGNGVDLMSKDRRSAVNVLPGSAIHTARSCRAIVEDRSGAIWARTDRGGLFRWNHDLSGLEHFTNRNSDLRGDYGLMLWLNSDGSLFTGWETDLINTTSKEIHSPTIAPGPGHHGSLGSLFCLYQDSNGLFWGGTMNRGLFTFRFDIDRHHIEDVQHYDADPIDPTALSNGFITCVREDRMGVIWAGTYGGGLNRFNPGTRGFSRMTMADGLSNNVIYAMEVDKKNRLWLSSNAGITCYDQSAGTIRNYGPSDRTQSLEFNANSSYQAPDGEIFFGGVNGFNSFYPDSIEFNPFVPPVVFTGLLLGHTPMAIGAKDSPLVRDINHQDTLELAHDQNDLTVKFAALSFISPEKNQFAYMLFGYKDEWVQLGTQNQISFTNLDPGRYELRVKASNNDGIWNEQYRSLFIHIAPPWYRTSLATAVFLVSGATFLFGLGWILLSRFRLRYQVALEHEEAERQKELGEQRSRFFINVAHDLRTPLTLIKQRVEHLATNPGERIDEPTQQVLRRSVNKLTGRITALLETAREERDHIGLDAKPTAINDLLHVIIADFRPMADDRGMDLAFVPATGDPTIVIDGAKVSMAVENLLANAFKFTPDGGRIAVTASVVVDGSQHERFRISVSDSGSGIDPVDHQRIFDLYERTDGRQEAGQVGAGVGLFHVRRIVEQHGGDWSIDSAPGQGTTIHLDFPLVEGLAPGTGRMLPDASVPRAGDLPVMEAELPVDGNDARPIALVIEDDPDLNASIADLLRTEFRTYRAFNGSDGIDKAFELIPDVIVTDVMMPGKNGFEVCRTLKADVRTSHVPTIILTAITDLEERIRGLHEGADDFLPKPYEPRELLARVRNAILRTQKVREFNQANMGLRSTPSTDGLRDMDRAFLEKVDEQIVEHLAEPGLDVVRLGELIAMSKSNLSRKLAALIARSPGELIREKRMTLAKDLLQSGQCNVGEAMMRVGYVNMPSFSNAFKEFWGKPPSRFLRRS